MASVLDSILNQLGPGGVEQIGRQIGADGEKTQAVLGAALPTLLAALSRNAADPEGANALLGALQRDHDGSILDNLSSHLDSGKTSDGDGILGHLLGSRRANIESSLSKTSGLDADSIGRLMAMVAPVVMGALGREQRQQGLGSTALSGYLTREQDVVARSAPAEMGLVGKLLDQDNDGDVDAGDLLKAGSAALSKFFGR